MYCMSEQTVAQSMTCPFCFESIVFLNQDFNNHYAYAVANSRVQQPVECPNCSRVSYFSAGKDIRPYLVSKLGWTMREELQRQKDEGVFWREEMVPVECFRCSHKYVVPKQMTDRMTKEYLPFNCPKCFKFDLIPGGVSKEPPYGWETGFGFLQVMDCPVCGNTAHYLHKKGTMSSGCCEESCKKCGAHYYVPNKEFFHRQYDSAYAAEMVTAEVNTRAYWTNYNWSLCGVKLVIASIMCGAIMGCNQMLLQGTPSNLSGSPGDWSIIRGIDIFMIAWPQMAVSIIFSFCLPPFFRKLDGSSILD